MPKKGAGKSGQLDPRNQFPDLLATALFSLYDHYKREFAEWERAGIGVPPVFIVVCNNTATSRLVYEWIAGFEREVNGERQFIHAGHLELFRNYDEHTGEPLPRMNTILVDSHQIESGTLDDAFKQAAAAEIERFRREKAEREGAAAASAVSDSEILREVMNTVGRKGHLGEHVRCVVSVSMLTEGWDANNVTHILGVRAFGSQLLCEQVVGRGLRRRSYDLNENGFFEAEFVDVYGIPFSLIPYKGKPKTSEKPDPPQNRVYTVPERARFRLMVPVVAGYASDDRSTGNHCEVDGPDGVSVDTTKEPTDVYLAIPRSYAESGAMIEPDEFKPQRRDAYYEGVRLQ